MRTLLVLAALLAHLFTQAQPKTIRPEPHWNYGDVRKVVSTTTVKVTEKDSVVRDTKSVSNGRISVPDLRKDYYILGLTTDTYEAPVGDMSAQVAELPEVFRDSVLARMRELMVGMYTPLMQREARFKVSRTGEAIEMLEPVDSKEDPRPRITETVKELQELTREGKRRTAQQVEAHRQQLVDSLYENFTRLQLDGLTLVLEPFTLNVPTTGSSRLPTPLKGVDLPWLESLGDVPAMMEIGADEQTEKMLVARTVTTADAEALHKAILAQDPKSKLKKEDLSLVKESAYTIDRTSGWLTQASTEYRVRVGTKKSRTTTLSVFTAEKVQ